MSRRISRKTLRGHLDDALWREALARRVIDALRACLEEPLNKQLEVDAEEAELTYRLARELHRPSPPNTTT